jgi:1,2-diacylglycerol 3-alpha-glucosyltransferase
MIIFGIRAHYAAIGGVENSIRNLVKVAAAKNTQTIIVCRRPINNEVLDAKGLRLPDNIKVQTYLDDIYFSIFRRLTSLLSGGVALANVYKELYQKYPRAAVIARHHAHALAAKNAGFTTVRYLVPSLIKNQLVAESTGSSIFNRLRFFLHATVDGHAQTRALLDSEVFVFSRSMELQIRKHINKTKTELPINIVNPGVDSSQFHPVSTETKIELRKQLGLCNSKKIFLFVGRLVKSKGIDYIVEAMREMSDECILLVVGDGDQNALIREKVQQLSLQDRVIICRPTLNIAKFFQASDVYVMSSTYECFGQTILESVACGMRVVAFHRSTGVNTATHELNIDHMVDYADTLDGKGLATAMRNSLNSDSTTSPTISDECLDDWDKLWNDLIPAVH